MSNSKKYTIEEIKAYLNLPESATNEEISDAIKSKKISNKIILNRLEIINKKIDELQEKISPK
ncbi:MULTISPECIES: hypothetical protein [unclassified Empedobacter]|uniref:hypothetical protein n=1 Tax=unclassified Empedobacter TaxID=2643773 RepID=UPI0025BB85B4|nr:MULTISPECIES: hypothetical protein [unclassified Empedobacter]